MPYSLQTDNLKWLKPDPKGGSSDATHKCSNVSVVVADKATTSSSPSEVAVTRPTTEVEGTSNLTVAAKVGCSQQIATNTANNSTKVIWLGKKIPQDRTIVKSELRMLNLWLYMAMVSLSLLGVFFAGYLIYFNFKFAHRR